MTQSIGRIYIQTRKKFGITRWLNTMMKSTSSENSNKNMTKLACKFLIAERVALNSKRRLIGVEQISFGLQESFDQL